MNFLKGTDGSINTIKDWNYRFLGEDFSSVDTCSEGNDEFILYTCITHFCKYLLKQCQGNKPTVGDIQKCMEIVYNELDSIPRVTEYSFNKYDTGAEIEVPDGCFSFYIGINYKGTLELSITGDIADSLEYYIAGDLSALSGECFARVMMAAYDIKSVMSVLNVNINHTLDYVKVNVRQNILSDEFRKYLTEYAADRREYGLNNPDYKLAVYTGEELLEVIDKFRR